MKIICKRWKTALFFPLWEYENHTLTLQYLSHKWIKKGIIFWPQVYDICHINGWTGYNFPPQRYNKCYISEWNRVWISHPRSATVLVDKHTISVLQYLQLQNTKNKNINNGIPENWFFFIDYYGFSLFL